MAQPPPHFTRTVDVLELVCEAVGFTGDSVADLLALRRCSHAWADAVSGAIRRGCFPHDDHNDHPSASGEMAPIVARVKPAARLCVVSQPYGAVTYWLREVPAAVLRGPEGCYTCSSDGAEVGMLGDVLMLLARVAAPTALHLDRVGTTLTADVVDAIASKAGPSLTSLTVTDTKVEDETAAALAVGLPRLKTLRFDDVSDDGVAAFAASCDLTHLDVPDLYGTVSDRSVLQVARHCPLLQHLNVSSNDGCVTDEGMQAVIEHGPHLQSLNVSRDISRVTDRSIVALAESHPQLRHLDVSFTTGCITDASLRAIARCCPRLESLGISGNGRKAMPDVAIAAVAKSCRELRRLDMAHMGLTATDATVLAIAEHCAHLRHLNVAHSHEITDASIEAIAFKCPLLEYLDVSENIGDLGGSSITDTSIVAVAEHCPQLTHLSVERTMVTDMSLALIARRCPRLRHLNVSITFGHVSDESLLVVAKHCRQLQYLNVAWTLGRVTDVSLLAIARRTRLEYLDVSGTRGGVTLEAVEIMRKSCPGIKVMRTE